MHQLAAACRCVLPVSERFFPGASCCLGRVYEAARPSPGELVGWAMAVTALTMGFLITTVMHWAGARSFGSGLKYGSILGLLFWASVNFGLYASSHYFSTASVFADYASSTAVMTLSSAVAAWILGRGNTHN